MRFLYSSALAAILRAMDRAAAGGVVSLRGADARTGRLLQIWGLEVDTLSPERATSAATDARSARSRSPEDGSPMSPAPHRDHRPHTEPHPEAPRVYDFGGYQQVRGPERLMATDYDASRKTEEEQKEESLEALQLTSGTSDKNSGRIDQDEAEAAESFELPGADLSHEELAIEVTPQQDHEFVCGNCFMVQHPTMRATPGSDVCRDCA